MHRIMYVSLLLLALVSSGSRADTTPDLRPRYEQGREVRYRMVQHSENRTTAGAVAADSTMDQEITLLLRCSRKTEEGAVLELVYERLKISIKTGDTPIEFDSEGKPGVGTDPLAQALAGITGTKLTIHTDASGAVKMVEGGGETLGLGSLLAGGGAALPKDAIGTISPTSGAPARVRVGESWTVSDRLAGSLLGDIAMTMRHTLRRSGKGTATVSIAGSIEPAGTGDRSVFRVSSASTTGEYQWDTARGELRSLDIRQVVRVETDALGEARTMESTSTTAVSRIDADGKSQRRDAPPARTPADPNRPDRPRSVRVPSPARVRPWRGRRVRPRVRRRRDGASSPGLGRQSLACTPRGAPA